MIKFPPHLDLIILATFIFLTSKSFSQILPPIISARSHTICNSSDSLTLIAKGCKQVTLWNTGANTLEITVKNAGIYSAKCIENGFESSNSLNFEVFSNNSGDLINVNGNMCQFQVGSLLASNNPFGTFPQFYNNNIEVSSNAQNNINPYSAGSYFFKSKKTIKGNWLPSTNNANSKINDLLFINQNIGFVIDSLGELYKSFDSGKTWSIKLYTSSELLKIYKQNDQTLWTCGKKGGLYKSVDGGNIWSKINILPSNTTNDFNDIIFTDSDTGWITCNNGRIYKTTNSGTSWSQVVLIGQTLTSFIKFFDLFNGIVIYSNGNVYHTNNGGANWVNGNNATSENFTSIQFLDSLNILGTSQFGIIKKSINGGRSWYIIDVPASSALKSLSNFDNDKGWACGNNGTLYFSESKGDFWNNYSLITSNNLTKVFFLNDYYGWIADDKGKIFSFEHTEEYFCPSNSIIINSAPSPPNIVISECDGNYVTLQVTNCTGTVFWNDGTVGNQRQVTSNGKYFSYCKVGDCSSPKAMFNLDKIGAKSNIMITSGNHCFSSNPTLELLNVNASTIHNWFKESLPIYSSNNLVIPMDSGNYHIESYKIENNLNWKWINKKIPDATFLNAQFVSNSVAWAANRVGDIFKTEDGGKTWLYNNFEGNDFQDIKFFNQSSGLFSYIKNSTTYIFKTTNGGINWQSYQMAPSQIYVQYLYFINENVGWGVGTNESIVKTVDGGVTWSIQRSIVNASHLNAVFFRNENEGWAAGLNGLLFYTSNGGSSWTKLNSNVNLSISDIYFKNSTEGFMVTRNNGLFETKNGGLNWTKRTDLFGYESILRKLKFIDNKKGYLIGSSFYFVTVDGGKTWKLNNDYQTSNMGGFDIIDDNHLIFGQVNSVQISHDGGNTWLRSLTDSEEEITNIEFYDDYFASRIRYSDIGVTWNGGKIWLNFKCTSPRNIVKLSNNTLWLCDSKNIYISTDKGKTWSQGSLSAPINTFLSKIYFINNNIGFVVGTDKSIYKTIDGGANWLKILISDNPYIYYNFNDILFLNNNVGLVVASNGNTYKTTDQGLTWNYFKNLSTNQLYKIQFIDENTGWVSDDSRVFRTFDGGQNWISTNARPYFNTFEFTDLQNGYGSFYRSIYKTTNGGTTWELLDAPYNNLRCLDIRDGKLYVAGSNSNILKYSLDGQDLCPSNILKVIKPQTPIISSYSTIICKDIQLPMIGSNCNGSYNCSNGLVGKNIEVNQTGSYYSKCVSLGCESEQSNIINLTKNEDCINLEIIPDLIYVCPNEQIQINALGCTNGSITWSNGSFGNQINTSFTNNYTLEAYCSSGGNSKIRINTASDNLVNPVPGTEKNSILRAQSSIMSNLKYGYSGFKQNYHLISGNSILLQPGFEMNSNYEGVFKTEIKRCEL